MEVLTTDLKWITWISHLSKKEKKEKELCIQAGVFGMYGLDK